MLHSIFHGCESSCVNARKLLTYHWRRWRIAGLRSEKHRQVSVTTCDFINCWPYVNFSGSSVSHSTNGNIMTACRLCCMWFPCDTDKWLHIHYLVVCQGASLYIFCAVSRLWVRRQSEGRMWNRINFSHGVTEIVLLLLQNLRIY